jgi:hypothetical protein
VDVFVAKTSLLRVGKVGKSNIKKKRKTIADTSSFHKRYTRNGEVSSEVFVFFLKWKHQSTCNNYHRKKSAQTVQKSMKKAWTLLTSTAYKQVVRHSSTLKWKKNKKNKNYCRHFLIPKALHKEWGSVRDSFIMKNLILKLSWTLPHSLCNDFGMGKCQR